MNIGIFTDTYYPEINGVANSAYQLKKELEKRGNQVYVFTVTNPQMKEEEHHVYRIRSIPFVLLRDRRVSYSPAKKWLNTVRQLHLDVIHTQTEFTVGHIGCYAAKKLGIPLIHTYHTIYEDYTHYLRIPGNQKLKGIVRTFSRHCCAKADTVIVPTKKVKILLKKYGVNNPIQVQPTGIDPMKFSRIDVGEVEKLKEKYGLSEEMRVLLSVGRLSQEKNIEELLSFVDKIKKIDDKVHLLIVGDGPEKEKLVRFVRENQLEAHVTFTGEVEWKEIQQYYALGDVFVSASTSETQGLTYIEALASGRPLLVRQDECLDGILEEGRNGYAYTEEKDFLEGYEKLFSHDSYLKMEREASELAASVSADSFGKEIEEIYQTVCGVDTEEKESEDYEKVFSSVG